MFVPARRVAAGLLVVGFVALSMATVKGLQKAPKPAEWKGVQDVFGFPGDVLPEDVVRFNMPRSDLHVIYNHNVRDIDDRWRLDSNQFLVKFQYAFRY